MARFSWRLLFISASFLVIISLCVRVFLEGRLFNMKLHAVLRAHEIPSAAKIFWFIVFPFPIYFYELFSFMLKVVKIATEVYYKN